jgi:hypothetical protein
VEPCINQKCGDHPPWPPGPTPSSCVDLDREFGEMWGISGDYGGGTYKIEKMSIGPPANSKCAL